MCGIAGIYNLDGAPVDKRLLIAMTEIVRHRGPDDEGYLMIDTVSGKTLSCYHQDTIAVIKSQTQPILQAPPGNLAFGFRRLAILDLSPAGHQPMSNTDGTLWIVYNGEIYNYLELREELQHFGYHFTSNSDTEVILAAYQQWGVDCLQHFNGMWAFAMWDVRHRRLFCARDRFGIKPFAYFYDGKRFIFGSEIKQILINPVDRTLNMPMVYRSLKLNSFLCYGDETYFENVRILPHGHFIIIENGQMRRQKYYDLDPATFETSTLTFAEATEQYRTLFTDAVRLRMRSDVEVGSALSGGLDSSAIVCTAVKNTARPFQTFTAYYTEEPRYDERRYVEMVACQANITAHFVSPTPEEMLADFERMTWHNDFPVVGSSFISQYFVMRSARQNRVTVLLDGQGSDEITAGYNHAFYRYYADLLSQVKLKRLANELPIYLKNQEGHRASKILKILLALFFRESMLYQQETKRALPDVLSSAFRESEILHNIVDLPTSRLSNFLYNLMMSTSIQTLLHFEDRNSMAFSIESRVPFLDYRLVEFAFSLPAAYKIRQNLGKYIHREALRTVVPTAIMERRDKVNFAAPGEKYWLRSALRNTLEELLNSPSFRRRDYYDHKAISAIWRRFNAGDERLSPLIWRLFALEMWLRVFER